MLLFDGARKIYISSEKLRDNHRIVARSVRKLITASSFFEVFVFLKGSVCPARDFPRQSDLSARFPAR